MIKATEPNKHSFQAQDVEFCDASRLSDYTNGWNIEEPVLDPPEEQNMFLVPHNALGTGTPFLGGKMAGCEAGHTYHS